MTWGRQISSVRRDYRATTVCWEDHRGGDVVPGGFAALGERFQGRTQDPLLGVVILEVIGLPNCEVLTLPPSVDDALMSGIPVTDWSHHESRTSLPRSRN